MATKRGAIHADTSMVVFQYWTDGRLNGSEGKRMEVSAASLIEERGEFRIRNVPTSAHATSSVLKTARRKQRCGKR